MSLKYFIASDIHGCADWCGRMLVAFDQEGADRLILLGDLLYHGPRNGVPEGYDPMKVAEMLNARRSQILAVRGNCDTEVDQMVLSFPMLADYALLEANGHLVYLTHGHVHDEEHLPPLSEGDVLIHGHTHVQTNVLVQGIRCLNPGSVSLPKEDSRHAYMILTDGVFEWKTLDGETFMRQAI